MKKIRWLDLLIVLLDIVAVNLAHYLALVFRFYMESRLVFTEMESGYTSWMISFAPVYTAFCLLVFWRLRLYGGMWRYAGINDMNRIIFSSIFCLAFMYVGTIIAFPRRMPHSYYLVGAMLQFVFITAIRFWNRLWNVEKRKFVNWHKHGEHVLVIGAGEAAHRMVRELEEDEKLQPVCVLDSKQRGSSPAGRAMDGMPVYSGLDMLEYVVQRFDVKHVYIADPMLQSERKNEIERFCRTNGINLMDYGYAMYLSGNEELDETREALPEDVSLQKMIPFSPPDISEKEISEVVEALRSGWITTGPRTKRLQRRLTAFVETGMTDVDTDSDLKMWRHRTVCLGSATAALELSLRILGVREGDEVIVPAYTYTATASAALHCGAKVVFVDIRKDGDERTGMPEMDYGKLEKAMTPRTKAVIAVDLGGIPADYDRLYRVVKKKKNLFRPLQSDGTELGDLAARIQKGLGCAAVIGDSAHALGASRTVTRPGDNGGMAGKGEKRNCGRIANFTAFSFHAVKNFTTAEGGAVMWCLPQSVYDEGVTNDELYRMFQLMSLHGQSKDALAKSKAGAWEYDIAGPWYKCNMTDLQAAIGLRQMDRYPEILKRRREIIRQYDAVCDELGLTHMNHQVPGCESSGHLYLVRIPGADEKIRNRVILEMALAGVSTNVHYKPLPMMTAYRKLGWDIADFPNAYDYYRNVFTLPLHTLLSDEDVNTVCGALRKVMAEVRADEKTEEAAC